MKDFFYYFFHVLGLKIIIYALLATFLFSFIPNPFVEIFQYPCDARTSFSLCDPGVLELPARGLPVPSIIDSKADRGEFYQHLDEEATRTACENVDPSLEGCVYPRMTSIELFNSDSSRVRLTKNLNLLCFGFAIDILFFTILFYLYRRIRYKSFTFEKKDIKTYF